jgi:hypothetical protein
MSNNQQRIDERKKAYDERTNYLENAWKGGTDPTSWPVDTFHDAFMAACRGNAAPLSNYLTSDKPLSADNRKALARLIAYCCDLLPGEDGKPRKPRRDGAPGGKHLLWRNPNHLAAYMVRLWKQAQGRNVPQDKTIAYAEKIIAALESLPIPQRANLETVLKYMRTPSRERL